MELCFGMSIESFGTWLLVAFVFRHYVGPQVLYFLFYKKYNAKVAHLKIQKKYPEAEQINKEKSWILKSQLMDVLVMGLGYALFKLGYLKIYFSPHEESWAFAVGVFCVLAFSQDLYFYITHRILHIPYLYRKIHLVHHKSVLVTPFTSFSHHPIEKLIELLFFPLILTVLPVSGGCFILFLFAGSLTNMFGHAGFELKWLFQKNPDPLSATSVFHEMHHMHPNKNFALYFVIWDRLFGTEHKKYVEVFKSHHTSDS